MLFPHTATRRIILQPASAVDSATFMRTLLRTGIESLRPSVSSSRIFRMMNAAFLVSLGTSKDVIGFSTLHGLDPAGHIRCGIYLDPERARYGIGSEAIHLTINYAFATFNVDKVIAQTTQASFGAFGLTPEGNTEETVLAENLYFRGQLWDLYSFQVTREDWEGRVDQEQLEGILAPPLAWREAPG